MSSPEDEEAREEEDGINLESPDSPEIYVMQSDMEKMVMQRDHAVSRINHIISTMDSFRYDAMALQTRRDMLKEGYKNYNNAQSTLEIWSYEETHNRDEIEMQFIQGLASFENAIAQKISASKEQSTSAESVRLPAVDLPIFSGSGENWLEWFDKFNALIHRRSTLPTIQKYEYLKLSLRGTALGLIDSLPTTEANYLIAYEMLVKRYNNPKLLVQKHTRELFDLRSVENESATELRNLFDAARKHLRCLQILEQPVDAWNAVLIHLMSNKLDLTTRREWESAASGIEPPSYEQLENFVATRCQMLDAMPSTSSKRKSTTETFSNPKRYRPDVSAFTTATSQRFPVCAACGGEHGLSNCNSYKAKSVEEKLKTIRRLRLCYNCLKPRHNAGECRSRGCMKCDRKHHTSIHRESDKRSDLDTGTAKPIEPDVEMSSCQSYQETILPTALVLVMSNNQQPISCRLLLDSGSQSNFATKSFIRRLGITTSSSYCKVAGFGEALQTVHEKATVTLKGRTSNYCRSIPVLVTDNITGQLPHKDVNIKGWDIVDVNLADPEFHLSRPVDMLLGASILFDVLRIGNKQIGDNLPFMQNTALGWVVGGNATKLKENLTMTNIITEPITSLLCTKWTEEETLCEALFKETTTRNTTGRFVVRLPIKSNANQLGESKNLALDRFLQLEKRFEKNPMMRQEYTKFMTEYLKLGHMERIDENTLVAEKPVFYFPHHAVLRPDSSTTKLRTVFNGSAETSTGVSLNDVLMTGPAIQDDIFSILLRFRCPKYALTADIKKMYRQIEVHEEDRQFQLILWRFSPDERVETYRLNTVTYGTCSAPFTAARCLKQVAVDCEETYPSASNVIKKDFYMDDVLTGDDELDKLIELKEQITSAMNSAGFELHKWKSNVAGVVQGDDHLDTVKILGLKWNTQTDLLNVTNEINANITTTKRNILAEIQKVFDPLGLLSPVLVHGKLILQDLWLSKLEWDEKIPDHMAERWRWFCEQVSNLQTIKIPRHVTRPSGKVELHGFSDAAKRAYGAVVYVRTICENKIHVNLLCSKSRVSPGGEQSKAEDTTIPRMELRAATLLVELMEKVKEAMNVQIHRVHYWTDSMVTLDWISGSTKRWPTFVTNRVTKINQMTSIQDWHHVKSKENPADLVSRGTSVKKLAEQHLWWNGPEFLSKQGQTWEQDYSTRAKKVLLAETNGKKLVEGAAVADYSLLDRFSSFQKLQKVVAYCLRFKVNCLTNKSGRKTDLLSVEELQQAHDKIIKLGQRQHFLKEINQLTKGTELSSTSSLVTLSPFLDANGLLRVGGRIQAAGVDYNQQHPIILPKNSNITWLIAVHHHRTNLHVGSQNLLYTMRVKYWPIHGRSLVRKVVHNCVVCFRNNPKPLTQTMGQLPDVRITPGKPFEICGVDFGGPFLIKENFVRTQKTLKVYVALFICLKTRAVHLELVSSLSTASFIAALRRFSGEHGVSRRIYCDNATNFVGSKAELLRLNQAFKCQVEPGVREFCVTEGVDWKFIPPRSPNFGGIWEAGIKSVKYHLKRVLGSSLPTYEEMLTLLKQIQGCLNSRPISPLSADVKDPNPLTPGHFLIGGPITALPDRNHSDVASNRLTRFEEVQKNVQIFWKRWQLEYLNNLQQRTKKQSSSQPDLLIGQLCLIKEDNLPPNTWVTGRVLKVHPGPDGRVRVATLYTTKGEVKRSISKLCLLPFEQN